MSIHIEAKKGEIAETVLLPGDPLHAKLIAETYLQNMICYNKVRNMVGFTDTYQERKISVQRTGMGVPSLSPLTISDSLVTSEKISTKDRESTFREMMEIALEIN